MNAFDQARTVEARAKRILKPWFDDVAYEGRWIWAATTRLERQLQQTCGLDAMVGTDVFSSAAVDLKALDTSEDAPFEMWSNLVETLDGKPDIELSTRGWGQTCDADYVLIYTISSDRGLLGCPRRWRDWLNERPGGYGNPRRWQLYEMREQRKYKQRNRTMVLWFPHSVLVREVGFIPISVRNLELWDSENPFNQADAKSAKVAS